MRPIDADALEFKPGADGVTINGVMLIGRSGKTLEMVGRILKNMVDHAPTLQMERDGVTDLEADLVIANKRIAELEAQIEQARLDVCHICRQLCEKTKISFSRSMCSYGVEDRRGE